MDSTGAIVLIISLFIIMLGMGLSLTVKDFQRVLLMPKAVFIGFINQIILLPIIAYWLVKLFDVGPEIAIGILILSACPGGPTSNLLTYLAKGDTALSVTLTAVNSIITIFTIPIIVHFGVVEFMDKDLQIAAPVDKIAGSLLAIIALPLFIGMSVKHYSPEFAKKMDKPVRVASALVLVLVIVGLVIKEKAHLIEYFELALALALTLNVVTMLVGYFSAKLSRLNHSQAICISIESGNQNGTLAIQIAVVTLSMPELAIAPAVYSLVMFLTAIVPVWIGNKIKGKK